MRGRGSIAIGPRFGRRGPTNLRRAQTMTVDDATTNAVTDCLTLVHTTTGTALAGIGTGVLFRSEDGAGNTEDCGRITGYLTTVTDASEASALGFHTRTAGGALAEKMALKADGNLYAAGIYAYDTQLALFGRRTAGAPDVYIGTVTNRAAVNGSKIITFAIAEGSTELGWVDAVGNWQFDQRAVNAAAAPGTLFTLTGAAHGASTAITAAEVSDVYLNMAREIKTQGGVAAIAAQRTFRLHAPTIAASAAQTYDVAATVYVSGPPIAGANVTLTQTHAVWVDAGPVRIDTALAMVSGAAALGTMPTGFATAQNEWIEIYTQNGRRAVPAWAPA